MDERVRAEARRGSAAFGTSGTIVTDAAGVFMALSEPARCSIVRGHHRSLVSARSAPEHKLRCGMRKVTTRATSRLRRLHEARADIGGGKRQMPCGRGQFGAERRPPQAGVALGPQRGTARD